MRRGAGIAALLLLSARLAWASPEYIQGEQTAPRDVGESLESGEHAFRPPGARRAFTRLGEVLRKGALDLHLRNYYFRRQRDDSPNPQAWAQGGGLRYATPWWKDRLRVSATLYSSQKLYGPSDKDGTLLLKPGQKSFTVLGEGYVEARLFGDLSLKVYRQPLTLPYLNGFDTRMIPNTFESVSLFDPSGKKLVYGLAHTWQIKRRNDTRFISMTRAAGIDGPDRAVTTAGVRYTFDNGANLAVINHYGRDYMNIFYAEANSRIKTRGGFGFQLSGQYTRQHAIGDQLAGNFDARAWGIKFAASHEGMIITLARTSTANNTAIRSDWGGKPSYISLMVRDFDRAGEDAWLVGLSSDFRYFGENPFSAFVNYAWGKTPEHGSRASPDEAELNVTVDYKPTTGLMKGLWFRLRGAGVNEDGHGSNDLKEIRLIVNYAFSVF